MSFDTIISLGYGFSIEKTEKVVFDMIQYQKTLGSIKNFPTSDLSCLYADEYIDFSLFPDLSFEDYITEGDDYRALMVFVKESYIRNYGKELAPLRAAPLTVQFTDSWSRGMRQLGNLGQALGLPAQNTGDEPDTYGWVFSKILR